MAHMLMDMMENGDIEWNYWDCWSETEGKGLRMGDCSISSLHSCVSQVFQCLIRLPSYLHIVVISHSIKAHHHIWWKEDHKRRENWILNLSAFVHFCLILFSSTHQNTQLIFDVVSTLHTAHMRVLLCGYDVNSFTLLSAEYFRTNPTSSPIYIPSSSFMLECKG